MEYDDGKRTNHAVETDKVTVTTTYRVRLGGDDNVVLDTVLANPSSDLIRPRQVCHRTCDALEPDRTKGERRGSGLGR